ncbi:hypothetical protein NQ318_012010 [Aromia moschata]|uniref:Innexin n=1 Tax=Aromia moschata TaxID=1265417 RepID=A0AAV8Y8T0_9CUCU|nr:hypothetical protein NQ318_012010 [Aromia moschata]
MPRIRKIQNYSQLSDFGHGRIVGMRDGGMREAGFSLREIANRVDRIVNMTTVLRYWVKSLKKVFAEDQNDLEQHNMYALRYWACECICLINIIVQLYLMNKFFDGEFLSYGLRRTVWTRWSTSFPRVTKCIFHKYGASGSIQKHDSLCILPLNIVNEKTYIFIWFWFMILATMLTFLVVYRIVIIASPKIRPRIFHAKHRSIPIEVCRSLCRKVDLGDWWILMMLGTNMDPIIYREIISELAKKIETNNSH